MKILLILFFALIFTKNLHAEYVLPYPGPMPGNKLYKLMRIVDEMQKYWYWGNLAQFKYNLNQSDKYLVEAKTLFEYGQYLLAVKALSASDKYFSNLPKHINQAQAEGKDTKEIKTYFQQASKKHVEILSKLTDILPEKFIWTPEKSNPSELNLYMLINDSLALRQKEIR